MFTLYVQYYVHVGDIGVESPFGDGSLYDYSEADRSFAYSPTPLPLKNFRRGAGMNLKMFITQSMHHTGAFVHMQWLQGLRQLSS